MIRSSTQTAIPVAELKKLLHPSEESRYQLALVTSICALLLTLLITVGTSGAFLVILGIVVFGVWLATQMLQARLIGNAVRVSEKNFPELYSLLKSVQERLDYSEPVQMYVVEAGELNAFLVRLFRTRFIMLNSELVTAMTEQGDLRQLTWIVARFVGALKAKHLRFEYIRILISAVEQAWIFNLFLLPYERATQYSGDQIGLALCGDIGQAHLAMLKFVVGKDLAQRVNPSAFLDQAAEIKGNFFGWYSQILASHPHWTNRYLNLLNFARYAYPANYASYVATLVGYDQQRIAGEGFSN